jgi:hypothetical protein
VAGDVGQRLLDDAIARGGDHLGHRGGAVRVDLELDVHPRLAQAVDEARQRLEVGRRRPLGLAFGAQHAEQRAELRQRLARDLTDRPQRGVHLGGVALGDAVGHGGAQRDRRQPVADDVVDLARDAQALLGYAPQRLLLGEADARLQRLHAQTPRSHRVARELRQREKQQCGRDDVEGEAAARPVGGDERHCRGDGPRQPRAHRTPPSEVDGGQEDGQVDRPARLVGRAVDGGRRGGQRERHHRVGPPHGECAAGDRGARVGDRVGAVLVEAERGHRDQGGAQREAREHVGPRGVPVQPHDHVTEGRRRHVYPHPRAGGGRRTSADVRRHAPLPNGGGSAAPPRGRR